MKTIANLLFCAALVVGCQSKQDSDKVKEQVEVAPATEEPYIERIDAELDQVVSKEAVVEILAEGFDWTEGPLWLEEEGMLIFSDIPPNTIYSWNEQAGKQVYLTPSGYTGEAARGGEVGSNGLVLSPDGKLLLCQHGDRRLATMNAPLGSPKPDYLTIVDNYQGKKLNSPNDAAFSTNGDLYFTDPPYGLEKNIDDPLKELPFQGVYRLDTKGELTLLTDQMTRPNGIALSNDQTKLYVANSDPESAIWMEFEVQKEGTLNEGRVFYDATEWVGKTKGLPDGLKVHPSGNIFATGPGGVWIFDAEGKQLGMVRTGQATSNCAFGNNYQYLYITADMYLMRLPLI